MNEDLKAELEQLKSELNKLREDRSVLGRFYSDHKRWIKFFTVGFVMTGLIVHATVPHIFQSGTVISAAQMNENFAHVMGFARGNVAATFTFNLTIDANNPIVTEDPGIRWYFEDKPVTLTPTQINNQLIQHNGNEFTVQATG